MLKTRGYNAIYLPWEGMSFPNNLQPAAGQPELTFDEFCANLAAAGVNRLRVKFCGWNDPFSGVTAPSFEPVLGQFNDWGGRLPEFVQACRAHNVGIQAIPFDNAELKAGWGTHAWNRDNGGLLVDPRDVFTNGQAIAAAKARIDAVIAACGDTVTAWEIMAEMIYVMTAGFWETDWAGLEQVTDEIAAPWVEEMAQYIKAHHPAPVGNGQVFGDATAPRNRVYATPSLDFALVNWYGSADLGAQVRWLRECQAATPWDIGAQMSPEPADLSLSKATEWAAVCGEYGAVGPSRWPEIQPKDTFRDWWGVAHPNMAAIAGVTAQFSEAVDLDDWTGRGNTWDSQITCDGLTLVSSWGDGRHVTAFLQWANAGQKTLTVEGLEPGWYTVTGYDFLSGDIQNGVLLNTPDGTFSLDVYAGNGVAAFYIAPRDQPEPPPECECLFDADAIRQAVREELALLVPELRAVVREEIDRTVWASGTQ